MSTLEKGKLPEELVKILKSLALEWGDDLQDIDNNLETLPITGAGIINQIYRLRWPSNKDINDQSHVVVRDVLVRIYGTGLEIFLDRIEDVTTFQWLSEQGEGPKLYGCLPNGRVEEFIHGRTLLPHELHDSEISALIAAKVRRFHSLNRPGSKRIIVWDRLRRWLKNAERLCCKEYITEFDVCNLEEEINWLEKKLSKESQVVAFCHNDLHCGNFLFNETTKSLTLIDYELAAYNPIAYDFANYFCEMTTTYTPHHFMDFSKYPGIEERHNFIRMYLTSKDYHPTYLEVEQLADDVEKYTLVNHLANGLWGIATAATNTSNNDGGFDYMKYARQRFQQYWLRKSELFDTPEMINVVDINSFEK